MKEKLLTSKQIRLRTIFAFAFFIIAMSTGAYAWYWLRKQPQDNSMGGIPKPLRKGLNANEKLFSSTFNSNKLAKTYPKSEAAKNVRVNGDVGMGDDFDPGDW